eukprot:CAMPEP_0202030110 /NCGR_PEP_ID=MMETSP0905-20130828/64327_1 /ASSEMBLY_ACC=CAM_ASM_000554 /TAXON_ID=420261 /ORGANISM="Thalassiosira antarctica, Strain CCMP982" /LENGTH=152 /DNA_ID=CAMNT_0048593899 /DNA_START=401 /DNA_END=860 /DNA_ORIENTATION=+
MTPTDSSFTSFVSASFIAASFESCSMPHADSSFLGIVGASFMAAFFYSCPILRPMTPTDSTFLDLVGASFVAASFIGCPMSPANTSLDNTVGAFCDGANGRPLFGAGPSFSSARILCFVGVDPELADLGFDFDGSLANASNKSAEPSPSESE